MARIDLCAQCEEELYRADDDATEYYELRHLSSPPGDRSMDIGGGKTMRLPNFDLRRDVLIGKFCSAKCLTRYVEAHIAPDAAGE